ncbi:hypothetical protein L3Q82_006828 [Scortum barcoo]|uniref:Uncharacterized protein n=1 Tax=Scortum barcoo TaxID=214431 RepID=A0ACB8WW03_9TELE|nr:hypothetical protein L3Q82_006828 [Scortum barcoo]
MASMEDWFAYDGGRTRSAPTEGGRSGEERRGEEEKEEEERRVVGSQEENISPLSLSLSLSHAVWRFSWSHLSSSPPGTDAQLRPGRTDRPGCGLLGLPVPVNCVRSPTGQHGPTGLLQLDGIPYFQCPPPGSGFAATTGTRDLASTASNCRIDNGGREHGIGISGSYGQAKPTPARRPLSLGNSRVVEGPAPLKELGSRAQAVHGELERKLRANDREYNLSFKYANWGNHYNGSSTSACRLGECPPSGRHPASFQFGTKTIVNRPSELNDFRPVALTSHLMMKDVGAALPQPPQTQVQHAQDRLQFCLPAYQPGVGVEDAILYLLHRAHSHLDKGSGTVRILFLDFSSAFNTIQPPPALCSLGQTEQDGSGPQLMDWISDYLTGRPQYVGLKDITS